MKKTQRIKDKKEGKRKDKERMTTRSDCTSWRLENTTMFYVLLDLVPCYRV